MQIMHQTIKLNKLSASKNENKLLTQKFDKLYSKLSILTNIKLKKNRKNRWRIFYIFK